MTRAVLAARAARRALSLAAVGLLGVATTLPVHAATHTTWQMAVGAQSNDKGIQVNAMLPRSESIDVGDTVKWTVKTAEFHTITFLSGQPQPPFITPGPPPAINPQAAAPAGGSIYSGSGYFNSGILLQNQTYSLTFAAPGDYPFVCLIHPDMLGTIHVAGAGAPYPQTQRAYDRQAERTATRLIAAGRDLRSAGLEVADAEPEQIVAGTGALIPSLASIFVPRYLPQRQVVRVGQTVTWNNIDPAAPHTVTFGPEPGGDSGNPLAAFAPSGTDRPGHATLSAVGQAVNSGFIGANLPFGTSFSATFTTPGTYTYLCTLHDELGMVGIVQVVPGD
jgi:plastocyanin